MVLSSTFLDFIVSLSHVPDTAQDSHFTPPTAQYPPPFNLTRHYIYCMICHLFPVPLAYKYVLYFSQLKNKNIPLESMAPTSHLRVSLVLFGPSPPILSETGPFPVSTQLLQNRPRLGHQQPPWDEGQ